MKSNKNLKRLSEPGVGIHLLFMVFFALATLYFRMYYLAAAEGAVIVVLVVYTLIARRIKERQLAAYIESVTYDTENAKNNTLMNFPLPIAVFRLDDSTIVWGNDMFFQMCGATGTRLDASITDMVPQFSGKWLLEGKTQYPTLLEVDGRKYQLHGNLIRSEKSEDDSAFMGITYWVDITEYDDIRQKYENSRPVPGIIVIDNLEELARNQPERVKNEMRDSIEEMLSQWVGGYNGIIRRYDRDRFLLMVDKQSLGQMKQDRFRLVEEMHRVKNPNGIEASISIGLGEDAASFGEGLQFADMATELALSRGGDQTVIKNRLSFEFFGGRGSEVEKRTKVRSRVMANTLAELVRDSSKVLVMGHKMADLDALGAAVGVCCLARKCGVKCSIVIHPTLNAVGQLLERMKREPEYKDTFLTPQEAMLAADGRTLLVVVDTNRPEQVEDPDLLDACNRVAVIDHHRVAATYIHNAALGFIEPYASSACELLTEILQEVAEPADVLRCEAEAMLSGIVLDTKSFSLRTGERTFDAAAWLRRAGADTTEVKKLFQTDMDRTVARYKILQLAEQYRQVAIAATEETQERVTAAKAADELLNISGVDASVVIVPDGQGGVQISARSIGELNVQILMEKLGGGGNRSAAAAQLADTTVGEAVEKVRGAIDEYLGQA
ncbi:MAG: DHH family phosphoesterase [Oscillospiraceae bacterium]|nr:DHH family phosphoesterase [Oscillospiraceae bacterium]